MRDGTDLGVRLAGEFADTASPETIQRFVDENVAHFAEARIQSFVPIFVERFTRERLRALTKTLVPAAT